MYRTPKRVIVWDKVSLSAIQEMALAALDETGPGDGFILDADRDLIPVCARLLAGRREQFHWSPLDFGPARWRVEVGKRAAPQTPETLEDALAFDHERLSALLKRFADASGAGDWNAAAVEFTRFELGVARHFRTEEDLLFPAFRYAAHLRMGPLVEVLCEQHRVLERNLAELAALVCEATAGRASRSAREDAAHLAGHFRLTMDAHTEKEETTLLPASDEILSAEQRIHLLSAFKLWRPEAGPRGHA